MAHTWQPKLSYIPQLWLFPGDLPICYTVGTIPKTRPVTLNSVIFSPTQADLIPLTIQYFFYLSLMTRLTTYMNINKQLKRGQTVSQRR